MESDSDSAIFLIVMNVYRKTFIVSRIMVRSMHSYGQLFLLEIYYHDRSLDARKLQ